MDDSGLVAWVAWVHDAALRAARTPCRSLAAIIMVWRRRMPLKGSQRVSGGMTGTRGSRSGQENVSVVVMVCGITKKIRR